MNCPSCHGIIGLDCFNPQECQEITNDMAVRYQEQQVMTEPKGISDERIAEIYENAQPLRISDHIYNFERIAIIDRLRAAEANLTAIDGVFRGYPQWEHLSRFDKLLHMEANWDIERARANKAEAERDSLREQLAVMERALELAVEARNFYADGGSEDMHSADYKRDAQKARQQIAAKKEATTTHVWQPIDDRG